MTPRKLQQLGPRHEKLAQPTIMNGALAAKYGVAYVRLCVFAIDVDRAYAELDDDEGLPFGWEVFLTECQLLRTLPDPGRDEQQRSLIEETCLSILEQPPDEQGYGSQLLFAIHDAVARGRYPEELGKPFRIWHKPPKQLFAALSALWNDADSACRTLAERVLELELDPPLAPPTRAALETLRGSGVTQQEGGKAGS
jgi:hypothetical protein